MFVFTNLWRMQNARLSRGGFEKKEGKYLMQKVGFFV